MKSYELQPTQNNILETFLHDAIGRNESIFDFIQLLDNIEDPCSIALNGYWGSGKTFFVRQIEIVLRALNNSLDMDEEEQKRVIEYINSLPQKTTKLEPDRVYSFVPVYYDAWINDNDNDPILSLVFTILEQYESVYDFKSEEFKDSAIAKALDKVVEVFAKIPSGVTDLFNREDWLGEVRKVHIIQEYIKEFLDSLLEERGDKLVIFIDELDRCCPQYAVRFLERIKHYFDNERIVFVFSINEEELVHTVKRYYGENFSASRYLDRFFDIRMTLPKPNIDGYFRMIEFESDSTYYSIVNLAVMKTFSFELREMAKYMRMVKMGTWKIWNKLRNSDGFLGGYAHVAVVMSPIIIGLRLCEEQKYYDFISGKNCQPLLDVYKNVRGREHFLKMFLRNNETFSNEGKDGVVPIGIDTVLERIYNAVMNGVFANENNDNYVGHVIIESWYKDEMLKDIGLLSNKTNFDVKPNIDF